MALVRGGVLDMDLSSFSSNTQARQSITEDIANETCRKLKVLEQQTGDYIKIATLRAGKIKGAPPPQAPGVFHR
jgi:hypothetical protein